MLTCTTCPTMRLKMKRIDSKTIEQLQELPIEQVVEKIAHISSIKNNTICCPFHAEKTPSCHLYEHHLHCFGCGAHTDNIGFVMLHKNLPFLAACQSLAETFHIELTYQDSPQHNTRTTQEDEHLRTLQQTLNTIRTLSIQTLNNAVPNDTSRKLEVGSNVPNDTSRKLEVGSREIESADTSNLKLPTSNLSAALIARFGNPHNPQSWCATWGLGYLPHGTLRAWAADNNSTEQLLELGLLTHSKKDGSLYSPFENRLLIPITNHWGHVVGFAARALNNTTPNDASTKLEVGSREVESDELRVTSEKAAEPPIRNSSFVIRNSERSAPKYINSPASALFKKGNILFGLAEARSTIHKTQTAHLVEGYTDVMRLHEVGVHSAVARMGTALTDEQIALLKRAGAQNIVILPDNDSAGIAAALKDSLALLKKGFAVSIALLGNKGDDPDSLFAPKAQKESRKLEVGSREGESDESRATSEKAAEPPIRNSSFVIRNSERSAPENAEQLIRAAQQDALLFYVKHQVESDESRVTSENAASPSIRNSSFVIRNSERKAPDLFTLRQIYATVGEVLNAQDAPTQQYYVNLLGATFKPRKQWQDLLKNTAQQKPQSFTIGGRELTPPDATDGSEVALQLREYGVARHNGVMWRLGTNGAVTLLSNFIARGLFFIATEGTTHRLIEIENVAGERQYIELAGDAKSFKTESDARLFFGKFGNYEFFGDKTDTIGLWRLILNECTPCKGISQMGWQEDGFWVWSNGVYVPHEGYREFSEYGTIKIGNRTYYSSSANRINEYALENRNRRKFAAHFSDTKFSHWQRQFLRVFGENGRVGILFMLTSLFRDIVQETAGMVPLLNAFGKCGTGKSVMLRSLSKLFFRSPVLMNLANSTLPSLDNAVHEYKNVLIAFDEYSVGITRDKVEFIKSMFDGGGRVKTVASSIEGMRYNSQSEICAAVCVAGQQIPDADAALLTRIISLEFTKSQYSDAEQDELETLLTMEQKGLAGIVHECLEFRKFVEDNFADVYTGVRRWVRKMLTEAGVRPEERIISTWSILLSMYELLDPDLHFDFSREEIISFATSTIATQSEDLQSGNELSTFWTVFSSLVQRGELVRGNDFKIVNAPLTIETETGKTLNLPFESSLLYLNMTTVYPLYVREMRQLGGHLFSRTTIQKYLKSSDAFISSKKSVRWFGNKKPGTQNAAEDVIGKSWVFALSELNLPITLENTEDAAQNRDEVRGTKYEAGSDELRVTSENAQEGGESLAEAKLCRGEACLARDNSQRSEMNNLNMGNTLAAPANDNNAANNRNTCAPHTAGEACLAPTIAPEARTSNLSEAQNSDELRVTSANAQEGESADTSNFQLQTSNLSAESEAPAPAHFEMDGLPVEDKLVAETIRIYAQDLLNKDKKGKNIIGVSPPLSRYIPRAIDKLVKQYGQRATLTRIAKQYLNNYE